MSWDGWMRVQGWQLGTGSKVVKAIKMARGKLGESDAHAESCCRCAIQGRARVQVQSVRVGIGVRVGVGVRVRVGDSAIPQPPAAARPHLGNTA